MQPLQRKDPGRPHLPGKAGTGLESRDIQTMQRMLMVMTCAIIPFMSRHGEVSTLSDIPKRKKIKDTQWIECFRFLMFGLT